MIPLHASTHCFPLHSVQMKVPNLGTTYVTTPLQLKQFLFLDWRARIRASPEDPPPSENDDPPPPLDDMMDALSLPLL